MFVSLLKKIKDNGAEPRSNVPALVLAGIVAISLAPDSLMAADLKNKSIATVLKSPASIEKTFVDAKVVSASPVFADVLVPQDIERCALVRTQIAKAGESTGGSITDIAMKVAGGALGAVAGNQIGGGNGQKASIAIGALFGYLGGEQVSESLKASQDVFEERQECHTETRMGKEKKIVGYDVEAVTEKGNKIAGRLLEYPSSGTVQVEETTTRVIKG